MSLPLYQRVALRRDLPEHNLRKGDVAVLVDYVAHPEGGEPGCVPSIKRWPPQSMTCSPPCGLDIGQKSQGASGV